MSNITNVVLREEQKFVEVPITNSKKPEIDGIVIEKWQKLINLAAKLINVPSGLIMKISDKAMTVFLKSQNVENPYPENGSDNLGHGLYCESVIGRNKPLLIENALINEKWKYNPDVKLNMISYYGLPIKWPDNEFFGTICVLDKKTNSYNEIYKEILMDIKQTLEDDLKLLIYRKELQYYAEMDILTGIYNRRKTEDRIKENFENSRKNNLVFSVVMIDINKFKSINDNYGHQVGDEMLKLFAKTMKMRIRKSDVIGRWGGDEFLLLCPDTDSLGCEKLIIDIIQPVIKEMNKLVSNSGFCYGISEYKPDDKYYHESIKRADDKLYNCKKIRFK